MSPPHPELSRLILRESRREAEPSPENPQTAASRAQGTGFTATGGQLPHGSSISAQRGASARRWPHMHRGARLQMGRVRAPCSCPLTRVPSRGGGLFWPRDLVSAPASGLVTARMQVEATAFRFRHHTAPSTLPAQSASPRPARWSQEEDGGGTGQPPESLVWSAELTGQPTGSKPG